MPLAQNGGFPHLLPTQAPSFPDFEIQFAALREKPRTGWRRSLGNFKVGNAGGRRSAGLFKSRVWRGGRLVHWFRRMVQGSVGALRE